MFALCHTLLPAAVPLLCVPASPPPDLPTHACPSSLPTPLQEVARCSGSLGAAKEGVSEWRQEREALRAQLEESKAQLGTCQARNSALARTQKRLQEEAAAAEGTWERELAAARKQHAAAAEEAQRRLAATEAALASLESEKAEVVAERRAAEAAAAKAEGARHEAEVARATAEAELRFVREAKTQEIERWVGAVAAAAASCCARRVPHRWPACCPLPAPGRCQLLVQPPLQARLPFPPCPLQAGAAAGGPGGGGARAAPRGADAAGGGDE